MSYSDEISKLQSKVSDLNASVMESQDPWTRSKIYKNINAAQEEINRLRRLEWEEKTQRLDYGDDR